MTHRHNLHRAPCLDPVENPIPIKPEFPRSDAIGSERFLVPRLEFRVRLQVSNDPGHDDPLLMGFEVSNVTLRAFCERDPILHASMVSEKPSPLKMLAERGRDPATSDCGASAAVSRHGPPGEVSRRFRRWRGLYGWRLAQCHLLCRRAVGSSRGVYAGVACGSDAGRFNGLLAPATADSRSPLNQALRTARMSLSKRNKW